MSSAMGHPSLPPVAPHYIGMACETLLYGIYLVLACVTTWVLVERWRRSESSRIGPFIPLCSAIIFLSLTVHWSTGMYLRYHGFVVLGGNKPQSAFWLYNSTAPVAIVQLASYGVAVIAIDAMLVYRLWVVWSHSWAVAALPTLAVLSNLIGVVIVIYLNSNKPTNGLTLQIRRWTSAVFTLAAITNIGCTSLIAVRIFRNSMILHNENSRGTLMPVIWIIVESAAIYTTATLCTMALILTSHPMAIVMTDIVPPIIGICSNLLIVRLAFGVVNGSRSQTRSSASQSRSGGLFSSRRARGEAASHLGDVRLKVSITHHAQVEQDDELDTGLDHKLARGLGTRDRRASSTSPTPGHHMV